MATSKTKKATETATDTGPSPEELAKMRAAAKARVLALAASDEFDLVGGEIAGHWDPKEPNEGDPIYVRVLDHIEVPAKGKKDPFNMFAAEVLDGWCEIHVDREDRTKVRAAQVGEIISFIQTAQFDMLVPLLGGKFIIVPDGMREVPRGNMKVFTISQAKGELEPRLVFGRSSDGDGDDDGGGALPESSADAPAERASLGNRGRPQF
jgi:hypothetical protein